MMASNATNVPELLPDILLHVFEQLAGHSETLLNVSLTCRAWRSLALPSVYKVVDVSSHNNGRQPQCEDEDVWPMIYADYDGQFRPDNMLPRQRAFLRLLTDKPQLASYVKSFTWTLVWVDDDGYDLTEIDRQTWSVFSKMVNVTHLDLASLHHVHYDEYVRQNPTKLFPKVRDLRLLGSIHRGLARAIITSLNPCKLRRLDMDYLMDEGAFPNGELMSGDFAKAHAHNARSTNRIRGRPNFNATSSSDIIHDDLVLRQETGQAFIFPGPMWLPLHFLSTQALDSLTHLQVKLSPFSMEFDLRNYHMLFKQTARLIVKVSQSLESLVIVFGQARSLFDDRRPAKTGLRCGTGSFFRTMCYYPWCVKMAQLFLEQQLAALNENAFPRLKQIRFEGFTFLRDEHEADEAAFAELFQSIQDCRFNGATFTEISSEDDRRRFQGHDGGEDKAGEFTDLLSSS
ncbi:hypothetical protein WHR41_02423 [Cladosporium halotolerans]|uniref:F-box domain-containing protein n=1 Tax=Cladosporium halotolerans TaxID=1052096 RepID=A0AB34KUX5_9PEZI